MARPPIKNQPEVQLRPLPGVFQSAQGGEFGQSQARDTIVAAGNLERAANSFGNTAIDMQIDANDTRVDDLLNQFVSSQQNLLFTDKDAFYRKKGADAINGAQAATDKLLELKKEFVGLTSNTYQTKRLEKALNGQIKEANNGISRHVADQQTIYEKGVAQGTIANAQNQAVLQFNDTGLVLGMADVAEDAARRVHKGQSPEFIEAKAVEARSGVLRAAVATTLQSGNPRQALALYDKVKGKLDAGDRVALEATMKSTATEVEAENLIGLKMPSSLPPAVKQYVPQVQQAASAEGVPVDLAVGVLTQESRGNPGAVGPPTKYGTAKGLMQLIDGTAKDLGVTDPHDPKQAIPGGVKYLGQMLVKYNGDQTLALMGYNWGPGNTDAWIKAGKDPAKVPAETRDYLQKVRGYAGAYSGVGFDKANVQSVIAEIRDDPGATSAVKLAAITKLTRESSTLEAMRSAQIKGLSDTLEATTQAMIASPSSYKKGTLAEIAAGFDAAGDRSLAVNTRLLASMEDTLLAFSQTPKNAQDETLRTVAAALLQGKGKALADSLLALGKKDAADAGKIAGEDFAALKTAAGSGVRMETLEGKARGIVDSYVKAGDFTKAREAADFYDAQVKAQAVNQAPPTQVAAAIGEMRGKIEAGEQTNSAIRQLDAMEDVQRKQAAAFDKDALATGASVYGKELGPLPQLGDLPARAAYATSVSKLQEGRPVLPFTEPEIENLRRKIDTSPPEQQAQTMQALSALPAEMIPGVAAALAGKKDTGDQLSRSYAAALSFYAEKDPAARQIADQILGGARITKEMGDAGKKAPTSSQGWQTTLNDRMGNIFFDIKGLPAVIADAVASVYTYQMHKAGRQGETIDTTMLDKAITAVIGKPVNRHGQDFLPPVKGMEAYEVDRAVLSITDADLAGLRTLEGDPITADVVKRKGLLSNAGQDGVYFVRIPDPRANGDPRPVVDADGKAWRLDLRPFVERSKTAAPGFASDENAPTGMRRDLGRRYLPQPAPAP